MNIYSTSAYADVPAVDANFPTNLLIPAGGPIEVRSGDTAYVVVSDKAAEVKTGRHAYSLLQGMYASVTGPAFIEGLVGFVAIRKNYDGLNQFGGPAEKLGKLRYIDGCSDTLLLSPPVKGDPCLNYLHVPPFVSQTAHTHPSVRIGCVVGGEGVCRVQGREIPLLPNQIFLLPPEELHSFHTTQSYLSIVVYHPDSDFGPTHEDHPMINKTEIDGKKILSVIG